MRDLEGSLDQDLRLRASESFMSQTFSRQTGLLRIKAVRCGFDRSYGLWNETLKWHGQGFSLVVGSTPVTQSLSCNASAHSMHNCARNLSTVAGLHFHYSNHPLRCLFWAFTALAC